MATHYATNKKGPLLLTSLVTVIMIIFFKTSYDEKWYYKEESCPFLANVEDMIELSARIKTILTQNKIQFFLCHGTLWGILRSKKLLPWDEDLDICVVYNDWITIDQNNLYAQFRWEQLGLDYDPRQGLYNIRYSQAKAKLIFYEYINGGSKWLQRTGWENWIFQKWRDRKLPAYLVQPPLKQVLFYNKLELPVPHGGVAIQKIQYPDDWWRQVKPRGC